MLVPCHMPRWSPRPPDNHSVDLPPLQLDALPTERLQRASHQWPLCTVHIRVMVRAVCDTRACAVLSGERDLRLRCAACRAREHRRTAMHAQCTGSEGECGRSLRDRDSKRFYYFFFSPPSIPCISPAKELSPNRAQTRFYRFASRGAREKFDPKTRFAFVSRDGIFGHIDGITGPGAATHGRGASNTRAKGSRALSGRITAVRLAASPLAAAKGHPFLQPRREGRRRAGCAVRAGDGAEQGEGAAVSYLRRP